jgi:uncharacterized membrane protein YphA (DoxX/SURF4 family)
VVLENSKPWGFPFPFQPLLLFRGVFEHHRIPRSHKLQRLFSTFPRGWPGAGLLLLRAAIGVTTIMQGWLYLGNLTLETGAVGLLSIASGVLLLIGYLTPVAGTVAGVGTLGIALSWFPAAPQNLFDAKLPAVLAIIMSAAIVFLGPGACSIDARLFGRREIVIPPVFRSPR